jgi:hypothetical protein
LLTLQNLFCANFFIPRFDLGLVVQNHVQQGIMNFQFSVVGSCRSSPPAFPDWTFPRSAPACLPCRNLPAEGEAGRGASMKPNLRNLFMKKLTRDSIWSFQYFDTVFPSPTLARNILGSNEALPLFLTATPLFFLSKSSLSLDEDSASPER